VCKYVYVYTCQYNIYYACVCVCIMREYISYLKSHVLDIGIHSAYTETNPNLKHCVRACVFVCVGVRVCVCMCVCVS